MIDRCRNCGKPSGDQTFNHDWQAICARCGQLLWLCPGDVAECRVARLSSFGIIVELGDGVEGMVHVTELAGHPIEHPKEVVDVGNLIQATVLRIDVSEKRIGLSRKRCIFG